MQHDVLRRAVRVLVAAALCLVLAAGALARWPNPGPLDVSGLATGRYATAEALMEKTIFQVDVLRVYVRFGPGTQARVKDLATRSGEVSRAHVARVAANAEHAYVAVHFERDVDLDRFIEGVKESLRAAVDAGFIEQSQYGQVARDLPRWFGYLSDRGFEDGDELLYRVRPDSLRTLHRTHDGKIRLDQTDEGTSPRKVLLSGYLAPGADLHDDLLDSLLE
ncbi:MAG: hypothetical protein ACQEXJ_21595 [Myxococcota bacterium]